MTRGQWVAAMAALFGYTMNCDRQMIESWWFRFGSVGVRPTAVLRAARRVVKNELPERLADALLAIRWELERGV